MLCRYFKCQILKLIEERLPEEGFFNRIVCSRGYQIVDNFCENVMHGIMKAVIYQSAILRSFRMTAVDRRKVVKKASLQSPI